MDIGCKHTITDEIFDSEIRRCHYEKYKSVQVRAQQSFLLIAKNNKQLLFSSENLSINFHFLTKSENMSAPGTR